MAGAARQSLAARQAMNKLTLTFDNGPTPGITDVVLDTLDRFGVRTTFFMVGTQLLKPDARVLAEQAHASGHRIANHTYSHGAPLGEHRTAGAAREEILRMHELLGDLTGESPLFRPNGRGQIGPHLLNQEAVETLSEIRASVVLWSSVPKDRKVDVATPDAWLQQAKRDALTPGWTLMVLHDRPSGHPDVGPMRYLANFLSWTRDQGIEIVQEIPPEHMPLQQGKPTPALSHFVTPA